MVAASQWPRASRRRPAFDERFQMWGETDYEFRRQLYVGRKEVRPA